MSKTVFFFPKTTLYTRRASDLEQALSEIAYGRKNCFSLPASIEKREAIWRGALQKDNLFF